MPAFEMSLKCNGLRVLFKQKNTRIGKVAQGNRAALGSGAAGNQPQAAGGAGPTGSLRAFSRGTPRTIDAR